MINLFDKSNKAENTELLEILFENDKIRIEKIISDGETTNPNEWLDQTEDEFVILVDGNAKIEYLNSKVTEINKGENLFIPKHVKHRVRFTSGGCVWICIFIKY